MPPSKRPKSITIDGATYFIGDTVTLRAPDEQNDDFVARCAATPRGLRLAARVRSTASPA